MRNLSGTDGACAKAGCLWRSRGRALRRVAIVAVILAGSAMILTAVVRLATVFLRGANCTRNVKQVGVFVQVYAVEHGTLPPADEWCNRLMPLLRYEALLVCPAAPKLRCGYAFNRALGGLSAAKRRKLPHPDRTVVIFESDLGWNGAGGPDALVKRPRHRGKDVFAFADGSGRAVERDKESDLIWRP